MGVVLAVGMVLAAAVVEVVGGVLAVGMMLAVVDNSSTSACTTSTSAWFRAVRVLVPGCEGLDLGLVDLNSALPVLGRRKIEFLAGCNTEAIPRMKLIITVDQ